MKRLSLSLLVLAAACGSNGKPTGPSIGVFTAAPASVALGESTQLIFSAANATALKIDPGAIDVTGSTSLTVTPNANTTYTLTATGAGGTDSKQVAVTVKAASPAAFRVTHTGEVTAGDETSFTVAALGDSAAVNPFYRGTVQFTIDDAQGTSPAEATFTAADAGQITVKATFRTAGTRTLVVADKAIASAQGIVHVNVAAASATRLVLFGVPDTAVAGDRLAMTVTAFDTFGNVATGFTGAVSFSSSNPGALLPAGFTFAAADKGSRTVAAVLTSAAVASSITVASAGLPVATGNVTIKHGSAGRITLEGLAALVPVDTNQTVTATVRDAFGNPVTDYAGTLHFATSDLNAAPIADVTFTPAMQGTADVTVQFATDGDQSILVSDTANAALATSAATKVKNGNAAAYVLSALPTSAVAGEPLPLSITAVDAHGNVVKDYAKTAAVTSTDPSDRLPAAGGFTNGVRNVSLAFVTAGPHFATVSEVGGTIHADTSTVSVVSGDAVLFLVSGGSATAGAPASTTVVARDTFGNTVVSYSGTVSFSSSDPNASLPAAFQFGAGDSGQHTFSATFTTAGSQSLTVTDGRASGSASFSVSAAAGVACDVLDLPAAPAAGAQVGLRVAVKDPFGNRATGYAGTISLSSSDPAAQLGNPATFTATDLGAHAFTVQLRTAGTQSVTATDAAVPFSCQASAGVVPGATLLSVAFTGPDAWAGTAVNATITAQDAFANVVPGYTGTVAFTSSDSAATLPANATFAAADNGRKTVSVIFNSIGSQTFTATDTAAPATTGTGAQNVHGLVYTNPASGGKVRLVARSTSTPSVVQLDLVSNTSLFPLTAGTPDTVRNGAFAAGMNLPLDTAKVGPDTTLLTTTPPAGSSAVLNLGAVPQAVGAAIANGVLYTGVSQKRIDGATVRGDVAVRAFPGGNSFYYSVRLKLTPGAAPGTVFDGQALASNLKFRAAVRDRSGSDVFSGTTDFAIGKLEVK